MNPQATDSPPSESGTPTAAKTPASVLEIITASMVAAVVVHLVIASAGGMFVFPWIAGLFAVEPKPKVEKKETVEVEMVEPVLAEPLPPEVQPAPPDQPPPPESLPTPMEPQLIPPVVSTPVDLPDRAPLPAPRLTALSPTAVATPRTNSAPYVSSGGGSGPVASTTKPRLVEARFYEREKSIYPPEAQRRRIQGTVVLEAVFSPTGKLVSLEVNQSCGHSLLDREAVAHGYRNFYSATGQAERVLIPIEYKLVPR